MTGQLRNTLAGILNAIDRLAEQYGPDNFETIIQGSEVSNLRLVTRYNSDHTELAVYWVAPNEPETYRYFQHLAGVANAYRDELSDIAQIEAERPIRQEGLRGYSVEATNADGTSGVHVLMSEPSVGRFVQGLLEADAAQVVITYEPPLTAEQTANLMTLAFPGEAQQSASKVLRAPDQEDRQRWIGLADGKIAAKKPYVVAEERLDDGMIPFAHWSYNETHEIEFLTRDQAGEAARAYSDRYGITYGVFRAVDVQFAHPVALSVDGVLYVSISEQ